MLELSYQPLMPLSSLRGTWGSLVLPSWMPHAGDSLQSARRWVGSAPHRAGIASLYRIEPTPLPVNERGTLRQCELFKGRSCRNCTEIPSRCC